jgi:VanZ family protein
MRGRYSTGLLEVDRSGETARNGAERPARGAYLRAWGAVGLWTLLILNFSQGAFSAELTRSGIGPLMRLLGLEYETVVKIHFFIRKGAHLGEYAALGYLTLRAASLSLARLPGAALALGFALLVAAGDEAHQATVATRTGSPRDVALDLAGAGLGVALRSRWRAHSSAAPRRSTVSGSPGGTP